MGHRQQKAAEGEVPERFEAPSTPVGEATPATTDGEEAAAPASMEAAAEDRFSSPPTVNKAPEGGETARGIRGSSKA